MQLFHKFNYFHINTLKKQYIVCCPGFYLTVEISSFDSYSYHHHHLQTPEVNNASVKVNSGSVPSKTSGILCTFQQEFTKCWRRVPPLTKILIIPNAEPKKKKGQHVNSMDPLIFLIWCHRVIHLPGFCGVNWFASTLPLLLVSYHSSTRFPSFKNVLASIAISSLLLVILKHFFGIFCFYSLLKHSSHAIQLGLPR